jgi:hypothetical protein
MAEKLPIYQVRARNTSADSENKIHDNATAARFGFSGGLVPGVVVFGYLTVPIVARFPEWLERGSMQVRFTRPFYDGDPVRVQAEATDHGDLTSIEAQAVHPGGTICATASAMIPANRHAGEQPRVSEYRDSLLPATEARLAATAEALKPGTVLGTLVERLDLAANQQGLLEQINERLPVYFGRSAVAHPVVMLGIANHMLMQNVALGPWIHASSDLTNFSVARDGEEIMVRGSIAGQFERKGHEFVVLDLLLTAGDRLVQHVRHAAIYKVRPA